jgi:hypothetical protein
MTVLISRRRNTNKMNGDLWHWPRRCLYRATPGITPISRYTWYYTYIALHLVLHLYRATLGITPILRYTWYYTYIVLHLVLHLYRATPVMTMTKKVSLSHHTWYYTFIALHLVLHLYRATPGITPLSRYTCYDNDQEGIFITSHLILHLRHATRAGTKYLVFSFTSAEQTYFGANYDKQSTLRTYHNSAPIDLHREI